MLRTISSPVIFELPCYTGKGTGEITIYPKLSIGFSISSSGDLTSTEISPQTLQGTSEMGARFLQVSRIGESPIKIVEHIVSALVAAGITNAYIKTDTFSAPKILGGKAGFTPVIGPGIEPLFSSLVKSEKSQIDDMKDSYSITEKRKFEFHGAQMTVEPSNTFDVYIETNHPDLSDLSAHPLEIEDVMSHVGEYANARPIARLQNLIKYGAYKALELSPSTAMNGINPKTYIMGYPFEKGDTIIGRMQQKYQDGRNEHYYHTLYSDFIGELAIFFPHGVRGKIRLINTNHTTRISLLRMLKDSGIAKN